MQPLFVFTRWQQSPIASLMLQFSTLVGLIVEVSMDTPPIGYHPSEVAQKQAKLNFWDWGINVGAKMTVLGSRRSVHKYPYAYMYIYKNILYADI